MTANATTIQGLQHGRDGQPIDAVATPSHPAGALGTSLSGFVDTALARLVAMVAGPEEDPLAKPAASPSRAAIAGNPDPRITRSLHVPAHHS